MDLAELVLFGTVTDIGVREGVGERGPWKITTAYLAGKRQAYAVTLADDMADEIGVGDDVALTVYTTVYNGKADLRASGYYAPAARSV